jgi:hypothetical protein
MLVNGKQQPNCDRYVEGLDMFLQPELYSCDENFCLNVWTFCRRLVAEVEVSCFMAMKRVNWLLCRFSAIVTVSERVCFAMITCGGSAFLSMLSRVSSPFRPGNLLEMNRESIEGMLQIIIFLII